MREDEAEGEGTDVVGENREGPGQRQRLDSTIFTVPPEQVLAK